jgi:hypothetical protein
MEMNAYARPEVLGDTNHVKEHPGDYPLDTAPQEVCSNEHSPTTPIGPYVSDKSPFETFVGGAGI